MISGNDIVLLRRDDIPTIDWPGRVDLPGGARDGNEDPWTCAQREAKEEVNLTLPESAPDWAVAFDGDHGPAWFFVLRVAEGVGARLRLGDEGQACWTEPVEAYLDRTDAIPAHQIRLREWWNTRKG